MCAAGDEAFSAWWTGRDTDQKSRPGCPIPSSLTPLSSEISIEPTQTNLTGRLEVILPLPYGVPNKVLGECIFEGICEIVERYTEANLQH